jgi:mannitol/fructose-specific phosphotransferase system IIA component (Ntr-type)
LRAREGVTVNAAGHLRGDDPEAQVVRARSLVVSPEDEPRQHLRLMARLAERIEDEAFLNAWPRPVRLTI